MLIESRYLNTTAVVARSSINNRRIELSIQEPTIHDGTPRGSVIFGAAALLLLLLQRGFC